MAWDGCKYPHFSAHGRQPYWVLGKGLFYRVCDLIALGGFHPWITIEDPEIGLRYWANGKRLGILASPSDRGGPADVAGRRHAAQALGMRILPIAGPPLRYLGLTRGNASSAGSSSCRACRWRSTCSDFRLARGRPGSTSITRRLAGVDRLALRCSTSAYSR